MCGISGFTFSNQEIGEKMNDILVHRGPDSGGIFCDNNVTLAHRRLRIIDLSERGNQPLSNAEKTIWIVFNGEIYNFKQLRSTLESMGYKFNSDSDTEVIINAYKEWGYDCVKFFNGMWAFVIYDTLSCKLFLSKDRMGKKPLYYCLKNEHLIFSSEIKPLLIHGVDKELNKTAVSSFLSYRQVLGEETMFRDIFKLPPACNMIFDIKKGEKERIWEYWDVDKTDIQISENQAELAVELLLKEAVAARQVSDVPIGSINSGGLDSSTVTALMASMNPEPIRTFTVKFPEEGYDETPFAKLLAEKYSTLHREITLDTDNFFDLMKKYAKMKDEPIGIPNEIALYLLFKEVKKSVTVILSGEGADEIFAGYSRIFRSPFDFDRIKETQKFGQNFYEEKYPSLFKKYNGHFFDDEIDHFMYLYNYFPDEEKNSFLQDDAKCDYRPFFEQYFKRINGSYEKKISYIFLKVHLPGLLLRLDSSSMFNAVEARCPFLDYRLVNFVLNIPFSLKNPWKSEADRVAAKDKTSEEIAENYDKPKYILKKVAERYIPFQIVRRKKQGFPLPLQKWFGESFLVEAKSLLFSKDSKIAMVTNTQKLEKWIDDRIRFSDRDFGLKLWMLVSLELWLREWFA
jgi:asparagine synthase (glutamine-hydrolysing)